MNMTKKKTALLAMILIAVFAVGFVAGFWLAPTKIYVTVEEAISIAPSEVTIPVTYPGENATAIFNITNKASVPITLIITVSISEENATYAEYFGLIYDSPFEVPANAVDEPYTVLIHVDPSVDLGTYIFDVTWER